MIPIQVSKFKSPHATALCHEAPGSRVIPAPLVAQVSNVIKLSRKITSTTASASIKNAASCVDTVPLVAPVIRVAERKACVIHYTLSTTSQ